MLSANLGFQRRILEKEVTRTDLTEEARKRAMFLLLWDAGASLEDLAKHVKMTTRGVRLWQEKFVALQMEDMTATTTFVRMSPRRGRPVKRRAEIFDAIGKLRKAGKVGEKLPGSVTLAKETGIPERTIRRVLQKARVRRRVLSEESLSPVSPAPTLPPSGA